MALLDIIGHNTESGELQFTRGNIGTVTDIVAQQNTSLEVTAKPKPKPTLVIAL